MKPVKVVKDWLARQLLGKDFIPGGMFELANYFRHNSSFSFDHHSEADGSLVAISTNFRFGSIVTHGRDDAELERNIKDAILTSFEIPSAYAAAAKIEKIGQSKEYALA